MRFRKVYRIGDEKMIKAVIFDWGGVLIENPAKMMIQRFAASLGVTDEALNNAYRNFMREFQTGRLSEEKLWEKLCRELNVSKPYSSSLWGEVFAQAYHPRTEMFLLASALKEKGYTVGLLSNCEMRAMEFFQQQHYNMFDVTVFSCAEGTWKPEKDIYQIALQRLDVEPQETVFIDDRKDFLEGAQKLGIYTILFNSSSQVKEELEHYLSVKA